MRRTVVIVGCLVILLFLSVWLLIQLPVADEPDGAAESCNLTLLLHTNRHSYLIGQAMLVTALVRNGSKPGAGATVSVVLSGPNMTEVSFALFDDGSHEDGEADDGEYAGRYLVAPSLPSGIWHLVGRATKANCTANASASRLTIHAEASRPLLEVVGLEVREEAEWGNPPDGVVDAGEHATIRVALRNIGNDAARGIEGTLRTTDPLVSVTGPSCQWSDIHPNNTGWSRGQGFRIKLGPLNTNLAAEFLLVLSYTNVTDHIHNASKELTIPVNKAFEVDLGSSKSSYSHSEAVIVTCQIETSGLPVADATVTYNLTRPDLLSEGPYSMHDDGSHGDAVAGDGEYTDVLLLDDSHPLGVYHIEATARKGQTTGIDEWSFTRYLEEGKGEWMLDLTGGMVAREGEWFYDKGASYSMRARIEDHWVVDTNWLRHYLPEAGKGFVFVNVTLQGQGHPNHTVSQDWMLGTIRPHILPMDLFLLDGELLDSHTGSDTVAYLDGYRSDGFLLAFEVGSDSLPANMTVADKGVRDAQILLEVPVGETTVRYPEIGHIRNLDGTEGVLVSRSVSSYCVGSDGDGTIVVITKAERSGGGSEIKVARRLPEGWVDGDLGSSAHDVTSLAFASDNEGRYLVVYSTVEGIEKDPPWSVDNTSLWLAVSENGGESWSTPNIIYSQVVGGEAHGGLQDLALAQDECGTLWVGWTYVGRRVYNTWTVDSRDRGLSWSEPREHGEERLMSLISDRERGLGLIAIDHPWFGRGLFRESFSTDCGATWQDPTLLLAYEIHFGQILATGDGIRWMLWLREWDDRYLLEYSPDQGTSWSTHATFAREKGQAPRIAWGNSPPGRPTSEGSIILFWLMDGDLYHEPLDGA